MVGQPEGNWVRGFFERPMLHAPGTRFAYDNCPPYVLSAIVQQVTGMTTLDYLQSRLFGPLGIDHATWTVCPRGINVGFAGLSLTTAEIALFGQLYLQKGMWQGQRLLPEAWVDEATRRQVANGDDPNVDEEQGYGYLFWRIRNGAYRGDGAFGQFCEVWPDQDVVLAITGGKPGMEAIQDLVWEHVLPAMSPQALPDDPLAQRALHEKLASLSLEPAQGSSMSPMAAQVSKRTYDLSDRQNPEKLWFDFGNGRFGASMQSISLDFGPDGCICTIHDDRGVHQVACGAGHWCTGVTTASSGDGHTPQPVAASGAWTAGHIYEMQWCFLETATRSTLICRFEKDTIAVDWHEHATFADEQHPQLRGRAVMTRS
jgi:hypothetical protein